MFASLLLSWALLALAVGITAAILPGFSVQGAKGALIVAGLFGLLHALLGWVLFIAIGVGTLGIGFLLAFITRWIVGAIVLKIVDSMTDRLSIRSFGRAFWASALMSGLGTLFEALARTF